MKKSNEPIERLEKVLTQAYHAQKSPALPSKWRDDVMRDIRLRQTASGKADPSLSATVIFQRMVLPFASVAAIAAIILVIYTYALAPGFEQDLLALITEDPSGLLSTQILGM